jgi:hypothetical protein
MTYLILFSRIQRKKAVMLVNSGQNIGIILDITLSYKESTKVTVR